MENCPKVYFKVNKNLSVMIPVSGLISKLDKEFLKPEVLEANKKGYNDYTRDFIHTCDKSDVFYSESYNYNPKTFTFNFDNLKVCEENDYIDMSTNPSQFDHKKVYSTDIKDNSSASFLQKMKRDYPCPDVNSGFYVEERRWNILLRNIMKHKNTMLVGPTGTGKTDVIIRICKALNIPCRIYDMGAMMDPLTDLLGSHRLENGTSKFDYAKFVQDVQEPGVILLDELSRAPQMTNNILFPCLDDRRTLPVEIADSKGLRSVPVHPECTFIATANIGSEYSGTNELDAALENRFMTIQVDYLPKSIESQVISIRTGCDERSAMKIVGVANAIRERYLDGSLSKTISTRETLACGELIVDGFSLLEAVNFSLCEKFPKYGENSEYDTVKKIVMGF
jgi:nitric oxide reductase NorQ protein